MLALLFVTLALGAPTGGPQLAAPDSVPPLAVLVRDGRFIGSGVVWDGPARRVLTALHVVEGMDESALEVVTAGAPLAARVVDRDALLDLALLEVAGPLAPGPALGAAAALAPGEAIALSGCPETVCGTGPGRVLAASRAFAGARYLAVEARVRPGASGGPVLDGRGLLVGIVDLALLREPGVALAVPVELAAARFPRGG